MAALCVRNCQSVCCSILCSAAGSKWKILGIRGFGESGTALCCLRGLAAGSRRRKVWMIGVGVGHVGLGCGRICLTLSTCRIIKILLTGILFSKVGPDT